MNSNESAGHWNKLRNFKLSDNYLNFPIAPQYD
jgi:hypothetical protein